MCIRCFIDAVSPQRRLRRWIRTIRGPVGNAKKLMVPFYICDQHVKRQRNVCWNPKIFKNQFPMNVECMLLGILPENIEKTSEGLFRYMMRVAGVILAINGKQKNAQAKRIGKINWCILMAKLMSYLNKKLMKKIQDKWKAYYLYFNYGGEWCKFLKMLLWMLILKGKRKFINAWKEGNIIYINCVYYTINFTTL